MKKVSIKQIYTLGQTALLAFGLMFMFSNVAAAQAPGNSCVWPGGAVGFWGTGYTQTSSNGNNCTGSLGPVTINNGGTSQFIANSNLAFDGYIKFDCSNGVFYVNSKSCAFRSGGNVLSAGDDRVISLPSQSSAGLNVKVLGFVNPSWSFVSGPKTPVINVANGIPSFTSMSLPGVYTFRLTAGERNENGEYEQSYDDMKVTVNGNSPTPSPALTPALTPTPTPSPSPAPLPTPAVLADLTKRIESLIKATLELQAIVRQLSSLPPRP